MIDTPSGLRITKPVERLQRFCSAEYSYYDVLPKGRPDAIEPIDVVATVGLNSRIDTAKKIRTVHLGMDEQCRDFLQAVPEDASLDDFPIERVVDVLSKAMETKYVLLASATKVLHRKRPHLIPVLDFVVVKRYLREHEDRRLLPRSVVSRPAATAAARIVLPELKIDLQATMDELLQVQTELAVDGFWMTTLRILDVLVWSETEPNGYYRL